MWQESLNEENCLGKSALVKGKLTSAVNVLLFNIRHGLCRKVF